MTAVSMIVIAGIVTANDGDINEALPAILMVFLLAGLIQIGFGWLRVGQYIRYVPYPVVSGFMSGIGVIILVTQALPLMGYYPKEDIAYVQEYKSEAEEVILVKILQEEAAEVTGRGSGMRVAWAGNSLTFWNDLPALLEEFADVDRGGPSSLAVATCVRSGAGLASLSEDGCGQALSQGPHGMKPADIASMLQPTHSGWDAVNP